MDNQKQNPDNSYKLLVLLASFVIIIAGMKAAASLVVPFLLAAFITIISSSPFNWMQRKGIPKVAALLVIIFSFILIIALIGLLIGSSIGDFLSKLPFYEAKLKSQTEGLILWLVEKNILKPDFEILKSFKPSSLLQVLGDALNQVSSLFADGFLILFTVIFMLLEISSLPAKLKKVFLKSDDPMERVNVVYQKINKYFGIKTALSIATGILAYFFLLIIGVDYALLWAVLASVLYFIPTIGSMIALIPPVLLSLIQYGFMEAIVVLIGFIIINTIIGNIIEPKFMGRGLELSTLVVFISLIFWGWVLGPIGMLLSVPLTITIKITLESSEETRWLAILLGPSTTE